MVGECSTSVDNEEKCGAKIEVRHLELIFNPLRLIAYVIVIEGAERKKVGSMSSSTSIKKKVRKLMSDDVAWEREK